MGCTQSNGWGGGRNVTSMGRISDIYRKGQPFLKPSILPAAENNRFVLKCTNKDMPPEWFLIPGLKDGTEFIISNEKSEFISDEQLSVDLSIQARLDLERKSPISKND